MTIFAAGGGATFVSVGSLFTVGGAAFFTCKLVLWGLEGTQFCGIGGWYKATLVLESTYVGLGKTQFFGTSGWKVPNFVVPVVGRAHFGVGGHLL